MENDHPVVATLCVATMYRVWCGDIALAGPRMSQAQAALSFPCTYYLSNFSFCFGIFTTGIIISLAMILANGPPMARCRGLFSVH